MSFNLCALHLYWIITWSFRKLLLLWYWRKCKRFVIQIIKFWKIVLLFIEHWLEYITCDTHKLVVAIRWNGAPFYPGGTCHIDIPGILKDLMLPIGTDLASLSITFRDMMWSRSYLYPNRPIRLRYLQHLVAKSSLNLMFMQNSVTSGD